MRSIILLSALVVAATAYEIIPIVKHDQEVKFDGTYHYTFETENGITHSAIGDSKEVRGNYKYTSPDGTPIEVTYMSGINGFQPYGAHIPTIPPHVERALEYIRTHPRKIDPYNRGQ